MRAELTTIAERIRDEGISAPAVIVVGEVAALHDQLAWFRPDGEAAGFLPLESPQPLLAAAGD